MKRVYSFYFGFLFLVALILNVEVKAQQYDYLDVPQGFETLNKAIASDTTAAGQPKSLKRVYRLERGGFYLLNGNLKNVKSSVLRVFAADGTGALPIIVPATDQTGASYLPFKITAETYVKNVYVSGINDLGNFGEKNMFRMDGEKTKLTIEGCFLDYDAQSFIRMNAKNQKLFIKNSVLRNSGDLASPNDGRFWDTRGLDQDTMFFQNTTFYTNTSHPMRTDGQIFQNLIIDHCTFYQIAGTANGANSPVSTNYIPVFDTRKGVNVSVTNNLFMEYLYNGDAINKNVANDTLDATLFGFVPLASPTITDDSRKIVLRNNAYGISTALEAYFKSQDTVKAGVWTNKYYQKNFFDKYPAWVNQNNFQEFVKFSDAPSSDLIINLAKYRRTNKYAEANNPKPWSDRNGIKDLVNGPTTFGPNSDEYNFDYPTSAKSYTAGDKGFPLGDLNWFPAMKTLWDKGGSVGIENESNGIPADYVLEQNYPNPFNPTTLISFSLPKLSTVTLKIFNVLGQEVITLINSEVKGIGKHTVEWSGKDLANCTVAAGVYIYQLKAGSTVISKKMLLVK